MLKRHEVQVLLKAGHGRRAVAAMAQVSESSVKRIGGESPVDHVDDGAERSRRSIGRPSLVESHRELIAETLKAEPNLPSVEVLRRAREKGYTAGKSALYTLIASLRPKEVKPVVRFEGLADSGPS